MSNIIKRAWSLSATVAVAALVLTGCASGDNSSTDSGGASTPAQAARFNAKAAALLPKEVRESGVLRVGTNAPNPPMWFMEENNSTAYSGTEYDLVVGIAEALGLKAEITNQNWDGLMPALEGERYDMVIGSIGDRPERREKISFVNYATTGTALLVRVNESDKFTDHKDMCGKSIGYQTGAGPGKLLPMISDRECVGTSPIKVLPFADQDAAFPALSSGQIDAIAIDSPQAYYWASAGAGGNRFAAVLDDLRETLNYGVGIKRGNDELVMAVQAALNGLIESGDYKKAFSSKGLESIMLEKATIDSAK